MPLRSSHSIVEDVCAWALATLPEIRSVKPYPASENPGELPELCAKTLRIVPNVPVSRTSAMASAPTTAHSPAGRAIEIGLSILIPTLPESKAEPRLRDMADRLIAAQQADRTLGKALHSSAPECAFPPVTPWTDGSVFAELTVSLTVVCIP